MRLATLAAGLFVVACQAGDGPLDLQQNGVDVPANSLTSTVASLETGGTREIPEVPPEDRVFAKLSPAHRRDFDAGYRDCRNGQFRYEESRHGEYYRIGCMAAENLKSDRQ